jgi:nucleotide-binding universal stress UspA family protein
MFKALIPVDGSANSDRAVMHVIAMAKGHEPVEIHLLNVQEPADNWELKRFMPQSEIEAMQESRGGDSLASARELLDKAGIPYTPHVLIGPVAETIAHLALEQGCNMIVMGTRGSTSLGSLLLGSVTTKVIHLAAVPVTLVK